MAVPETWTEVHRRPKQSAQYLFLQFFSVDLNNTLESPTEKLAFQAISIIPTEERRSQSGELRKRQGKGAFEECTEMYQEEETSGI